MAHKRKDTLVDCGGKRGKHLTSTQKRSQTKAERRATRVFITVELHDNDFVIDKKGNVWIPATLDR